MTEGASDPGPRRGARLQRLAPVLGLFLLAPLTAEYLLAYGTWTGDVAAMAAGLIVLAPLYGGPAIVIREVARRAGRGWPTILLLATAFGVIQAGLVDHSLFNPSYLDIEGWQELAGPTLIPVLGVSGYLATTFIAGHAIWSIAVPIVIVEAFVPSRRTTPWLGGTGLSIVVVLYLLASAVIFWWHVTEEAFLPTPAQLGGAAAVAVVLIGAGLALGRRKLERSARPAPSVWAVGMVAFGTFSLPWLLGMVFAWLEVSPWRAEWFVLDWTGVVLSLVLMAFLAAATLRWSRRRGWGTRHALALAGGALLTKASQAFLAEPIGDVSPERQLAHNAAFVLGGIVLLLMAGRCAGRSDAGCATGSSPAR